MQAHPFDETPMANVIARAALHRPEGLIPAVLPQVADLMEAFEPHQWQFIEALYEDQRPITVVKCTFGLVAFDDETLPIIDPLVSKVAAFDTTYCQLAYFLEDRFSDRKVFQVWERLPYRKRDFIEQLAGFLSSSGLVMTLTGHRDKRFRELLLGQRTMAELHIRHNSPERVRAARDAAPLSKAFMQQIRPRLQQIQRGLTIALRPYTRR
jgi:hypothetical protein